MHFSQLRVVCGRSLGKQREESDALARDPPLLAVRMDHSQRPGVLISDDVMGRGGNRSSTVMYVSHTYQRGPEPYGTLQQATARRRRCGNSSREHLEEYSPALAP
ncbi:hypothetical protein SKAU_G00123780 [Synaphobranchus kaupii]|uniref:Uncharacterized protein n=1 Tax=Synaphobranchus kaupii TaxID=118154 RepID=A0A9Q1FP77_SYNKA|nr:hypothetical protein SKAU_G00123780 [Synaphobranchus kaupii]